MSNYTKTTDFDVKDSLPSGDTGKIIRGSEFEVEFENIEVAIASKADATNPTFAGTANFTNVNITGNTTLGNAATDTVTVNADFSSDLLPSADATYDLGAVGSEWQDLYITGTANIDDLSCGTASFSGDLAVNTDTLFVDVSANRVGIGTDTPASILELEDATSCDLRLRATALRVGKISVANGYMGFSFDSSGGNTERMRIDDSGNVGIGTTSPTTNLEVADTNAAALKIRGTNTSAVLQIEAPLPSIELTDTSSGASDAVISMNNSAFTVSTNATERVRIDSNGNVGIGTSSPATILHLAEDNPLLRFEDTAGGTPYTFDVGSDAGLFKVINTTDATTPFVIEGATGDVGIGTTNPAADLEVSSDANTKVRISDSTNVNQRFEISHNAGFTALTAGNNAAKGVLAFYQYDGTDTTEAMRLDASGNLNTSFDVTVGIGSTSSLFIKKAFDATAALKFQRTTAGTPVDASVSCDANENLVFDWNLDGLNAACLFNSNGNERFRIENSGKVGIGVSTALGGILTLPHQESISFHDASGLARKVLEFDTGELKHGSAGFGLSTQTFFTAGIERARIDGTGGLTVGHTAQIAFNENTNTGTTILNNGAITTFRDAATANMYVGKIGALDGDVLEFRRNGIDVGSISVTSGATAYNTSSDVRLKENITDAPEGNVDALQVRSFDWKVDGSHQEYGFIAQELEAVAPYAVTKGETEDDMWGVDYSKLVPMLVKEIQDLKARIATLEAN